MENEILWVQHPHWPEGAGPLPRKLRNPHTEALDVLSRLDAWGVAHNDFKPGGFTKDVFGNLFQSDEDPDVLVNEIHQLIEAGGNPAAFMAIASAAMCAKAFKAYNGGEIGLYAVSCGT